MYCILGTDDEKRHLSYNEEKYWWICHSSHLQLVFGVVLAGHVVVYVLHELGLWDSREAELSLGRRHGIGVDRHLARIVDLVRCSMIKVGTSLFLKFSTFSVLKQRKFAKFVFTSEIKPECFARLRQAAMIRLNSCTHLLKRFRETTHKSSVQLSSAWRRSRKRHVEGQTKRPKSLCVVLSKDLLYSTMNSIYKQ